QLLRRRACPNQGPEVRTGAGADAGRGRGGGAPRLLRADLALGPAAIARCSARCRADELELEKEIETSDGEPDAPPRPRGAVNRAPMGSSTDGRASHGRAPSESSSLRLPLR